MKIDEGRVLGWIIPMTCMVWTVIVIRHEQGLLQEAEFARGLAVSEVAIATTMRDAVDRQIDDPRTAVVPTGPEEQNAFLAEIRQRALAEGVSISDWTSTSSGYTDATGLQAPDGTPVDTDLLKDVTRYSSTLSLSGSYPALRRFIGDVLVCKRLYNFSAISWTRGTNTSTVILNVTLSRYVSPSQSQPAPTVLTASNVSLPALSPAGTSGSIR